MSHSIFLVIYIIVHGDFPCYMTFLERERERGRERCFGSAGEFYLWFLWCLGLPDFFLRQLI